MLKFKILAPLSSFRILYHHSSCRQREWIEDNAAHYSSATYRTRGVIQSVKDAIGPVDRPEEVAEIGNRWQHKLTQYHDCCSRAAPFLKLFVFSIL